MTAGIGRDPERNPDPDTYSRVAARARSTPRSAAGCTTASACTSASSRRSSRCDMLLDRYPEFIARRHVPTPASRRGIPGFRGFEHLMVDVAVKIGINGNKFVATGDVALLGGHAREAADAGARRATGSPSTRPAHSTRSTALAIIGRDVPELALGVGVVPVWGRHPVAMAAQALTVGAGRARADSPSASASRTRRWSASTSVTTSTTEPLATMREYLEVLVPLVTTGTVDHEGDRYTCRTTVALAGEPRPTVLVAALGEKMLRARGPPRPRHHHVMDRVRTRCATTSSRPSRSAASRRRQPAAAHRVDLPGLRDRRRRPRPRAGAPVVRVPRQGTVVRGDARARRRGVGERRRDRRHRGRGAPSHPRRWPTSASPTSSSARCSRPARPTPSAPADSSPSSRAPRRPRGERRDGVGQAIGARPTGRSEYRLEDQFGAAAGRVTMSGVARAAPGAARHRARATRQLGRRTAGIVCGYRGSPLGTVDTHVRRARGRVHRPRHPLRQRRERGPRGDRALGQPAGAAGARRRTVDGVVGLWYGEGARARPLG